MFKRRMRSYAVYGSPMQKLGRVIFFEIVVACFVASTVWPAMMVGGGGINGMMGYDQPYFWGYQAGMGTW